MPSLVEIGLEVLEKKLKSINVSFRHFAFEKGLVLHLNKLESHWCQVCLKLAQLFWRGFINSIDELSLFRNYLSLIRPWPFN